MGIFSKSPEAAQTAVTKAEGEVMEWEAKAAAARAEASRLDAESGATILEDPSAAERVTLSIQAQERTARAYDGAAAAARKKLRAAQRDALEAEAREEDKLTAAATKALKAHNDKVDGLLKALQDLDGCEYAPAPSKADAGGSQIPKSTGLWRTIREHEIRAALIRYFIATGKITHEIYELNTELGTNFQNLMRTIPGEGIEIPASIVAARNAGISFTE